MSTDRDVTRIVRSWLEEGATALPDRVLDGVIDAASFSGASPADIDEMHAMVSSIRITP